MQNSRVKPTYLTHAYAKSFLETIHKNKEKLQQRVFPGE